MNGEEIALTFMRTLASGKYDAAHATFDATMKNALSVSRLKQVWTGMVAQLGSLQSLGTPTLTRDSGFEIVLVPLTFEKGTAVARVVSRPPEIAGLHFLNVQAAVGWTAPPYSPEPPHVERPLLVGRQSLPGTLTLPAGKTPFPAVVLVHGSGPNDQDETVGANKPFKDIAWALAANGVAALRYEKRSRARPESFMNRPFTVDDEAVDDAVDAVVQLQGMPEVDARRVFLIGHSLGGQIAPRVAQRVPSLAGMVLLAPPARPLAQVLREQLARAGEGESAESSEELAQARSNVSKLETLTDKDRGNPELLFGAPAAYWIDLNRYDAVGAARELSCPVMVIHGGRDAHLSERDVGLWKNGLKARPFARVLFYPDLDHLLIRRQGPGGVEAYASAGHVDERVVDDITTFIRDGVGSTPGAGSLVHEDSWWRVTLRRFARRGA